MHWAHKTALLYKKKLSITSCRRAMASKPSRKKEGHSCSCAVGLACALNQCDSDTNRPIGCLCQSLVIQKLQMLGEYQAFGRAVNWSTPMPARWPPLNLEVTHLFRALLRECSYLPDPIAKEYFKKHVVTRFRRHWTARGSETSKSPPSKERQRQLLKTARKGLGTLTHANDGDHRPLYKVLSFAYGRSGRRRRDLISELQAPETTANVISTLPIPDLANVGSNAKVPRLTPQAEAIARSQANHGVSRDHKALLRHVQPKIPEKNAWMRPMPQVRVKNMTAEWYANTLDRLLPPLPDRDLLFLQRLVRREEPWSAPAFRLAALFSKPTRSGGKSKISPKRAGGQRLIPRRMMQRLWTRVLALCPVLSWNEKKPGWIVTWGDADVKPQKVSTITTPTRLFDGVDENGRVLKKRSALDPATASAK